MSMYVFGGVVITFLNIIAELFSGHFVEAFLEYSFSARSPTSISQVILQPFIGTTLAGPKWYIAMNIK